MTETFSLEVTQVSENGGLVHIQGRWCTGSALGAKSLTLERSGEPLTVHQIEFGEEALSLLLICGKFQSAAKEVHPGDRLIPRR